MSAAPSVRCIADTHDKLGEGCFWDAEKGHLWWLDIVLPSRIHRLHLETGEIRSWAFPEMMTAMARRANGGLIVGGHHGIHLFDPETGRLQTLVRPEAHLPGNRGNDGACDAKGRFWFGTMMNNIGEGGSDLPITASTGNLYRIGSDGKATLMEEKIGVSNGPCWSPDNRTFYFTDSMAQIIWAYDFDAENGTISNRRVFNDSKDHGCPDGATVDREGFLWSARWEGHSVLRIDPKGRIDRVVPIPASRVTNVCFGGPGLETMFVTTAYLNADPADLKRYPQQGGLFAFEPGVSGFEKAAFAG
jgi:sugar lactone lactonase YvrE